MKKLSLTVLALIVMAGTIFASSSAWSFTPDLTEECFLSDYSAEGVADLRTVEAVDQDFSILQAQYNENKTSGGNALIHSGSVINEELAVSSWSSISETRCNTVNPVYDITDNGSSQKRVDVRLC